MYEKNTITHLVLSGGGGSGFIYIGALRYLQQEQYNKHIKHISGTSIGSLFGFLFALNISMGDVEHFFKEKLESFEEKTINLLNLLDNFGIINKDDNYFFKMIKLFLEKHKYDKYTFLDLAKINGINLHIHTVHFDSFKEFIFNVDNTPNVLIIDAICASMSIPLIFTPYKIGTELYIDGGLTNNIPINPFYDVNNDNILIIQCHKNYNYKDILENNNIVNYFLNMINMANSDMSYKNLLKKNYKNYLSFKEIPIKIIPYKLDSEFKLKIDITNQLIEESVIKGYEETYEFLRRKI